VATLHLPSSCERRKHAAENSNAGKASRGGPDYELIERNLDQRPAMRSDTSP
jgi:hypothetical protein